MIDLFPLAQRLNQPVILYGDRISPPEALSVAQEMWPELVRRSAQGLLRTWAQARMASLLQEREHARAAAELGLPSDLTEIDGEIAQARSAFQQFMARLADAADIEGINAVLEEARGIFQVPSSWEPYPDQCPWEVGGEVGGSEAL